MSHERQRLVGSKLCKECDQHPEVDIIQRDNLSTEMAVAPTTPYHRERTCRAPGLGDVTELTLCFDGSRSLDILRELLMEGCFVRRGETRLCWMLLCFLPFVFLLSSWSISCNEGDVLTWAASMFSHDSSRWSFC